MQLVDGSTSSNLLSAGACFIRVYFFRVRGTVSVLQSSPPNWLIPALLSGEWQVIVITNCCASLVTGAMDVYIVACTSPSGKLMDAFFFDSRSDFICFTSGLRSNPFFCLHKRYLRIVPGCLHDSTSQVSQLWLCYAEHKLRLTFFLS